jgi:hypothetical protein
VATAPPVRLAPSAASDFPHFRKCQERMIFLILLIEDRIYPRYISSMIKGAKK